MALPASGTITFAQIHSVYNSVTDIFLPPKPTPSHIINEAWDDVLQLWKAVE